MRALCIFRLTLGHVACNYFHPICCLILIRDNFMYLLFRLAQGRKRPHIRDRNFPGKSQTPRGGHHHGRGAAGGGADTFRPFRPSSGRLRPPCANTRAPFPRGTPVGRPRSRCARFPPNVPNAARFPYQHLSSIPRYEHTLRGSSPCPTGVRGPPQITESPAH